MIKPWSIADRKPMSESGDLIIVQFRRNTRVNDKQVTIVAEVPVYIEKGADEDAVIYQQLIKEGLFE